MKYIKLCRDTKNLKCSAFNDERLFNDIYVNNMINFLLLNEDELSTHPVSKDIFNYNNDNINLSDIHILCQKIMNSPKTNDNELLKNMVRNFEKKYFRIIKLDLDDNIVYNFNFCNIKTCKLSDLNNLKNEIEFLSVNHIQDTNENVLINNLPITLQRIDINLKGYFGSNGIFVRCKLTDEEVKKAFVKIPFGCKIIVDGKELEMD
jgi:hypothetical protein